MENGPFIDDFPIKTSIYKGFSMAMLNKQMVDPFFEVSTMGFPRATSGKMPLESKHHGYLPTKPWKYISNASVMGI